MPAKLVLRDIAKSFEGVAAVRGISLSLGEGEFVSLLGPSGCGKSTTLAMIAGFVEPDAGEVLVDGERVNRLPPQRRHIGLVFQDYAVFSRLTVRDNLAFGLEVRRMARAERAREVERMARRFELEAILGRRGASLNMSEMQRVALARVLVTQPKLLLLDEPMSNLDASLRASMRAELKQIQRELGQTVLYVTHDQVEAMSMSDRIAVMREGCLLQIGTPEDIYLRPETRFVAEFIGDPPINLIPCRVRRQGARLEVRTACHRLAMEAAGVEPGEHWLAVRPHAFRVSREGRAGAVALPVRFVENLGAEHVLHVQYGDELVRMVVPAHFAREGEEIAVGIDTARVLLIDGASERVAVPERVEAAA